MRNALAICAFVLLLAVGSAGAATAKPSLKVVKLAPFTVHGNGFKSREHVRLVLTTDSQRLVRRPVASSTGRFKATFADVIVDRCNGYGLVVRRPDGTLVTLKVRPACPPA